MKKQKAFTLIELLVTSSITALMMLAMSSLFITFLATAYKSRISQNLRESGNNAIKQIIEMIRSSSEITSPCIKDSPLNYITLVGPDGLESIIREEDDRIASVSATNKFYLTESSANPNYINSLIFKCYPTPEGKKYIEISFNIHTGDNTASNSARSTTLDFGSGMVTRN
jgi:prepilin-type N-terminal cleavage/methylation domain-containing protein